VCERKKLVFTLMFQLRFVDLLLRIIFEYDPRIYASAFCGFD